MTTDITHTRLPKLGHLIIACLIWSGCEPTLIVGEWTCTEDGSEVPSVDAMSPIAEPWSTSFEAGFCDYSSLAGFCYADAAASYELVTHPVHSGRLAAAFSINTADSNAQQTRCVRQGALPMAAYYGAWYFVPELATNSALWNLFHFQGGTSGGQHGLWDVSLENTTPETLNLFVFDFLNGRTRRPASPKPIPVGAWFHVELYLKRSATNSGAIALYQDGELILEVNNLRTDDTAWGQWYVGNLAYGLAPAESTLYVDDVSIRASR